MTLTKEDKEILQYCYKHIEIMWAAKITSIILKCDFRDSKCEIEKLKLEI